MSGRETVVWPSSSADDYMHRPMDCILENMCLYEMVMKYKKMCKRFKEMRKVPLMVNSDTHSNKDDDTQGTGQHNFPFLSGIVTLGKKLPFDCIDSSSDS